MNVEQLTSLKGFFFPCYSSNRCLEPGEGLQASRRAPEVQHEGVAPSEPVSTGGRSKNLYANAHSMWWKEEELEKGEEACERPGNTAL